MSVKFKKRKASPSNEVQNTPFKKEGNSFLPQRFYFILFFIALLAGMLFYKSTEIQYIESERYIKEADKRSIRTNELPFLRGRILDRNGRLIAVSMPNYSITFNPKNYFEYLLKRNEKMWLALAQETETSKKKIVKNVNGFISGKGANAKAQKKSGMINPKDILDPDSKDYWGILSLITGLEVDLLIERVKKNPHSEFLALERERRKLEQDKLVALAKKLGIKFETLMEKIYKYAKQSEIYLARKQENATAEYAKSLKINSLALKAEPRRYYPEEKASAQLIGFTDIDDQGAEGLERSFNSLLVGKNGKHIWRKDKNNNVIENLYHEQQYNPQDVVLSIDNDLQSNVYKEIEKAVKENRAESATAILVDVQTGEILVMANAPSFDPNNRENFKPNLIRNRAITDTFEPGSTVKPLVILTALQNKVTYPGEVIKTGSWVVNGHTIRDVSRSEQLSLTGILQKSSNVGVSRLALRMPPNALIETYTKVGFGKDTGLGLGEQKGTNGNRSKWSDIERATISFGYGLRVTPLQLVRAYATLGSFGIYRPLSITKVDPPVVGERVLPEKLTKEIVRMMESVAKKGEGSGDKAAVEGYQVAIKTGTVRKSENGNYVEKYIAYTAGIAPASQPRFALVVLLDEPKAGQYYGGAVSAPLFSSIMGYTLKAKNIKPDNIIDTEKSE